MVAPHEECGLTLQLASLFCWYDQRRLRGTVRIGSQAGVPSPIGQLSFQFREGADEFGRFTNAVAPADVDPNKPATPR